MITLVFIQMILYLATLLLILIPSFSLPTAAASSIAGVFALVSGIGYLVPLDVLWQVFLVCFAFYKIDFIWATIQWTYKKIPGIS